MTTLNGSILVDGISTGVFVSVHPEDLPALLMSLGHATESRVSERADLRLWCQDSGWVRTTLIVPPQAPEHSSAFGIITSPPAHVPHQGLEPRLALLETRLRWMQQRTR
jgi:hypothetical protein